MSLEIVIQGTPNPNARKYVLNRDVIKEGKIGFSCDEDTPIPLVKVLLWITHVSNVHLFENVITITQNGNADWDNLSDEISQTIKRNIEQHDSNITSNSLKQSKAQLDGDLKKIDEILERTIRPGLQSDGGDLEVISYKDNLLTINYQGACGGCPSSQGGTLDAIESILKNEFNLNISVLTLEN